MERQVGGHALQIVNNSDGGIMIRMHLDVLWLATKLLVGHNEKARSDKPEIRKGKS